MDKKLASLEGKGSITQLPLCSLLLWLEKSQHERRSGMISVVIVLTESQTGFHTNFFPWGRRREGGVDACKGVHASVGATTKVL